jgi:hypothetical protein
MLIIGCSNYGAINMGFKYGMFFGDNLIFWQQHLIFPRLFGIFEEGQVYLGIFLVNRI